MNSVWIVEKAGQYIASAESWVEVKHLADVEKKYCGGEPTIRRYVPASEVARLRRELAEWQQKAKTAIWSDSQELKGCQQQAEVQHRLGRKLYRKNVELGKKYNRMKKAVEWALSNWNYCLTYDEARARMATMAGLKWDGKKWVEA